LEKGARGIDFVSSFETIIANVNSCSSPLEKGARGIDFVSSFEAIIDDANLALPPWRRGPGGLISFLLLRLLLMMQILLFPLGEGGQGD